MTVTQMKTKAEQQLAQHFETVAAALPGKGWVADARRAAMKRVADAGLPSRRVEEWKYTDLRARMSEALAPAALARDLLDTSKLTDLLSEQFAAIDCVRLVVVDGVLVGEPVGAFAKGVFVGSLAADVGKGAPDWMKPHLEGTSRELPDTIVSLNTAFASDGALIKVEAGTKLAKPIHLVFVSTMPGQVTVRNLISVEAGASAVIIESHVAAGDVSRQSNAVTEIRIGDHAHVQHLKQTSEGDNAQHLSRWDATLGKDAKYQAFQLIANTRLVRNELLVSFDGEHSSFDLACCTLAHGAEHADTTLIVDHKVPHCTSRELYKAVLAGTARAVFQGKVIVRPDAQKTDGKQMAQAMMLSPDVEFDSKPELEIYADDGVCGHGSTVAEIDDDLMFYCRSRGIPEREARALLVESFIGEVVDKVEDEAVREAFAAIVARWLRAELA